MPPRPRGPPKPPPVFHSLSLDKDKQAPPKRRLSKFGTPDVNRPVLPKVLAALPSSPCDSRCLFLSTG